MRLRSILPVIGLVVTSLFVAATLVATVHAADPISQSVTQTYGVKGTVQKGMIVRLAADDPTSVSALKQAEAKAMHGVVVAANDAALTLSGDSDTKQVYVATYGRYGVLVSDQNGHIKAGDLITISAADGVGMKADDKQSVVLGRAVDDFNAASNVESTASLTSSSGQKVDVSIGRIRVDLAIAHNPLQREDHSTGAVGVLRDFSKGIAGKDVSLVRIYISLAVLIVSAVLAGALLFSGVRSGIVSIGRNPLARKSILRGLVQVIITSVTIFIIGLFGVYLLLKL